jgi:hypothetical protein
MPFTKNGALKKIRPTPFLRALAAIHENLRAKTLNVADTP